MFFPWWILVLLEVSDFDYSFVLIMLQNKSDKTSKVTLLSFLIFFKVKLL